MANCVVQFFIQANKFDDPKFKKDNKVIKKSRLVF